MTKEEIALAMVALKHALDRIRPAQDELRLRARELLATKERVPALIDGQVVGTVGKSSPKKIARVSDGAKYLAWMSEHYAEHVETVPYVEDMDAVIAVVGAHAPELVYRRRQVREDFTRRLLAHAVEIGGVVGPGGEADIPGITVGTPEGNVSVLMEKGNEYLVEQLFAQGRVSLDGTVRKEIEA